MEFENDIFVIGEYINTKRKKELLVSLISSLKQFNIPILLTGHYPVSAEIQGMCDYYLFDKENPMLSKYEFAGYGLECLNYWVETNEWKVELYSDSHDYCVWTLMRNAINFVESIGKKTIHYIDYDNFPYLDKYKNEFLLPIKNHDAVILEIPGYPERYATFIYSIKTNIATNIFNQIKTKGEYYKNSGNEVFIENVFFRFLNEISSNIKISKYKSDGTDLALCGKEDDNEVLTNSLVTDDQGNLYGYFPVDHSIKTLIVDIEYMGVKNEHILSGYSIGGGFGLSYNAFITKIGTYQINEVIKIYHNGIEVSTYKLDMEYDDFKVYNKINFKN